jgi:hypothetical protein
MAVSPDSLGHRLKDFASSVVVIAPPIIEVAIIIERVFVSSLQKTVTVNICVI